MPVILRKYFLAGNPGTFFNTPGSSGKSSMIASNLPATPLGCDFSPAGIHLTTSFAQLTLDECLGTLIVPVREWIPKSPKRAARRADSTPCVEDGRMVSDAVRSLL